MSRDRIGGSAALLIGGESRRMGTDKARVILDGIPLYQHVLNAIAPQFDDIILVGGGADDMVNESGIASVRAAPDLFPDRSSANGIYSALMASHSSWCCVLSCDAPFPCVPLLEAMKSRCAESIHVVATQTPEERLNPFHALWHTSAAPLIESSINCGELRLQKIMAELNVSTIQPHEWRSLKPEGRFALNINTPEDLQALRLSDG